MQVGESEGLRLFHMGKAFELGGSTPCLGSRECGYEVALRTGRVLLDWGCPVVILTGHICRVLSLCWALGMEAGPTGYSGYLLELAVHGGRAAPNHITSHVIKALQVVKETNRQRRQRNRT